jgi:hypothetical protein
LPAKRVSERTRLAQELHDTLLQSPHGSTYQFQAANNMFDKRSEQAMQILDSAISETEEANSRDVNSWGPDRMKWPKELLLIRHAESAYNKFKQAKDNDPEYGFINVKNGIVNLTI